MEFLVKETIEPAGGSRKSLSTALLKFEWALNLEQERGGDRRRGRQTANVLGGRRVRQQILPARSCMQAFLYA